MPIHYAFPQLSSDVTDCLLGVLSNIPIEDDYIQLLYDIADYLLFILSDIPTEDDQRVNSPFDSDQSGLFCLDVISLNHKRPRDRGGSATALDYIFTESALWADSVIESPCPCVCLCVCVSVCLSAPSGAVFFEASHWP